MLYRLKLTTFQDVVDVPSEVKGIMPVAEYICEHFAVKYASALSPVNFEANRLAWYDSHLPAIITFLEDLREKLRVKHA